MPGPLANQGAKRDDASDAEPFFEHLGACFRCGQHTSPSIFTFLDGFAHVASPSLIIPRYRRGLPADAVGHMLVVYAITRAAAIANHHEKNTDLFSLPIPGLSSKKPLQ